MPGSLRALRLLCCLLLTTAAGITVTSTSASATWTVYCSGYTRCANAGYSDAGYSKVSRTMFWGMYGGHNCTNYVAYRMVRAGMPNTRPWTGSGNATRWGVVRSDLTDQTPTVGAVAWWKANANPAGRAGHLAYVERVIDSSTIVVSQDFWGGDFSWARITKGSGSWPSGFVHFATKRLSSTAAPRITGTPQAGTRLSASRGSWSAAPSATTYQWKAGGRTIPRATSSTYTPTAAQVGRRLTVTVAATRSGYTSSSATSAATAPVAEARLQVVGTPVVSGTPVVGSVMTVTAGRYAPAPTSMRYRWTADGLVLGGAGAAAPSLAVTPALLGKRLAVRVVAVRPGYPERRTITAPSAPVLPGTIHVATTPVLRGVPAPGQTLSLTPGAFTPADAVVASRWWRVGDTVPLGRTATYVPTPADLGRRLEVRTTVTRPGYATLELRTPAGPVRAVSYLSVSTRSTGSPRGSVRVSAQVTARGVDRVRGTVRISRKGKLVATLRLVDGRASTTLRRLPVGQRRLFVRYVGTETVRPSATARASVTVR